MGASSYDVRDSLLIDFIKPYWLVETPRGRSSCHVTVCYMHAWVCTVNCAFHQKAIITLAQHPECPCYT